MNTDRFKYLALDYGFHVYTIGVYPDARIALVLSQHPIPGRQESALLELMCEIERDTPAGVIVTVDI